MQNNVYELVSDINTRQTLIDEKVLALEDRLLIIVDQIEALPELIKKALTTNVQQRSSLPTLVENISVASQNTLVPFNPSYASYRQYSNDYDIPPHHPQQQQSCQQQQQQQQQNAKHTYLHPNDAACLSSRPSWSTSNINSSMSTQTTGNYAGTTVNPANKQYLTPNVMRTSSFDSWDVCLHASQAGPIKCNTSVSFNRATL